MSSPYCINCGCDRCERNRVLNRERTRQTHARGKCSQCGKPAPDGKWNCPDCAKFIERKRQAHVAAGDCRHCRKPNPDRRFKGCSSCRAKIRAAVKRWIAKKSQERLSSVQYARSSGVDEA